MKRLSLCFCALSFTVSSLAQQTLLLDEEEPTGKAAEQLRNAIRQPMVFADSVPRGGAATVSPEISSSSACDPSGFSQSEEDAYSLKVEHRAGESLSLRLTPEVGYRRVRQLTNGEASSLGTSDNLDANSRAELTWHPSREVEASGWWQDGWLENYGQSSFAQSASAGASLRYHPSARTQCALTFAREEGSVRFLDAFNRFQSVQQGADWGLSLERRLGTLPLSLWGNGALQWNETSATTGTYGASGPEFGTGLRLEPAARQSWNLGVSASQSAFAGGGEESIRSIFTEWKQELSSAAAFRVGANYQEAIYQPGIADLSYSDQGNRLFLSVGPQVRLTPTLDARLDMAYRLGQPDLRTEILQIPDRWLLFSVQGHF